jgi:molecular chaperone GrpE
MGNEQEKEQDLSSPNHGNDEQSPEERAEDTMNAGNREEDGTGERDIPKDRNHQDTATGNEKTEEENILTEAEEDTQTNWPAVAQDRYDQLVRLQADFDNYRRRVDREREELRGYVTGAILGEFLPVYDNLERALKFMPNTEETKAWRMGVDMTLKGFNDVLNKFGVTPIPAMGTLFDPRVHEAVQRVDSDDPEGTIVEELLKGFQWEDRVLRASLVKVSTGQGTQEDPKPPTDSPA